MQPVAHVDKVQDLKKSMASCKKRSYDAAFQLKVVDYAKHNTNTGAARKHGVDEKHVREWKKQKDQPEGTEYVKETARRRM